MLRIKDKTYHKAYLAQKECLMKTIFNILVIITVFSISSLQASSVLVAAAIKGNTALVNELVEQGNNVNQADKNGNLPLHAAVAKGDKQLVTLLLDKGADINAKSHDIGWTPLQIAIIRNHPEIIQLLLDRGAQIDIVNAEGLDARAIAKKYNRTDSEKILQKK